MGIAVYEIKLKIYTLVDIPTEQLLGKEAAFIDSALGLDDQWIKYHEDNKYKLYSYDMLYPIEKDGGYLKDHIYTFRIRSQCRTGKIFLQSPAKSLHQRTEGTGGRKPDSSEKNNQ